MSLFKTQQSDSLFSLLLFSVTRPSIKVTLGLCPCSVNIPLVATFKSKLSFFVWS